MIAQYLDVLFWAALLASNVGDLLHVSLPILLVCDFTAALAVLLRLGYWAYNRYRTH